MRENPLEILDVESRGGRDEERRCGARERSICEKQERESGSGA